LDNIALLTVLGVQHLLEWAETTVTQLCFGALITPVTCVVKGQLPLVG
jgi:hypothetical protein